MRETEVSLFLARAFNGATMVDIRRISTKSTPRNFYLQIVHISSNFHFSRNLEKERVQPPYGH
jgi:hypothetical protein